MGKLDWQCYTGKMQIEAHLSEILEVECWRLTLCMLISKWKMPCKISKQTKCTKKWFGTIMHPDIKIKKIKSFPHLVLFFSCYCNIFASRHFQWITFIIFIFYKANLPLQLSNLACHLCCTIWFLTTALCRVTNISAPYLSGEIPTEIYSPTEIPERPGIPRNFLLLRKLSPPNGGNEFEGGILSGWVHCAHLIKSAHWHTAQVSYLICKTSSAKCLPAACQCVNCGPGMQ